MTAQSLSASGSSGQGDRLPSDRIAGARSPRPVAVDRLAEDRLPLRARWRLAQRARIRAELGCVREAGR
jgi:hypothetical protein